ncbi:hypothetical protein DZA50_03730 [Kangiella sp. HD9-110m-PIT-SAG07]|nr:hypothetical protein DZA50_03730 [Kangiella sp. HD9-110m-PIT-SAG07]
MKHVIQVAFIVMTLVVSGLSHAHGGHKSITGQEAVMITNKTIKQMTFKNLGFEAGKLPSEWKSVTNDNIDVLNIIEGYYIVQASINDTNTLYFQIAPNGEVVNVKPQNDF